MAKKRITSLAQDRGDETVIAGVVIGPGPILDEVDVATVKYRGNVRVYTRELHGDDFAELAKEFADKVGGVVA